MEISKTTFNMAKRRGLEMTVEKLEGESGCYTAICFWESNNDCEWLCSYRLNAQNLTWNGNVYLPNQIKEELPATIESETVLRSVIQFIATSLHFSTAVH